MLNTSMPLTPVATPDADPYYAIKQHMAANGYTKATGFIDGNYPFVLDEKPMEGEIVLPSGEKRRLKCNTFTAINDLTVDKINLVAAIKEGRFACFYIKDGLITEVVINHHWFAKMKQENNWEIAIRSRIDMNYRVPNESDDIGIAKLSNEQYLNLINNLGFNDFIRQ